MSKSGEDISVSVVHEHEAQVESFPQFSRVCLFFETKSQEDYQKILSFVPVVKSDFYEVEVLVFYDGKIPEELPENDLLYLFGKKDFNLLKHKKASLRNWLAAHKFDVLISFVGDNRDKNERIIKDVRAKMKVGPHFSEPGKHFDISIGKPGVKMNFEEFYMQVKHYISQLNIDFNR